MDIPWWKERAIYHVLVPSYYDTNDDGVGDLPGLTCKLEYLAWLGIGAVWLSPIYASPMADLGYDISSFREINVQFGKMADFDAMLAEAHRRNIRVILDWVPNHTSSEHPWFQESKSSMENPRRDWYIWRDPKPDGSPPNNWISIFGGSVWEYDEFTGQYYLHTFLESQPDLNWENPDMAQAIFDSMRFWLDKGVDGFRLDAIDLIIKDPQFRDNPLNPDFNPDTDSHDQVVLSKYTRNQPGVHEIVAAMRRIMSEYEDRVLAGELYLSIEELVTYFGERQPELQLPLNPLFASTEWTPGALNSTIERYLTQKQPEAWPCWMISSHDGMRIASRIGPEKARLAALLLLTLPGTPIMYYGDEIGMHNVEVPPECEQDPQGIRIGRKRDPVRTPMQWNANQGADFTRGNPWLPLARDFKEVNVNAQDGHSLLALYRRLLSLRCTRRALITGHYKSAFTTEHFLAYHRSSETENFLIILNFSDRPQSIDVNDFSDSARLLASTWMDRDESNVQDMLECRGNEGIIIQL